MLWFAPRKPGTGWSKLSKARVERALAAGLMMTAGMAKMNQAKQDGPWSSVDAVEKLEVPPDVATAFSLHPPAADNFDAFPRSVKRGIMEWIQNAKKADTRAKRVLETATLAAKNERANQWRK